MATISIAALLGLAVTLPLAWWRRWNALQSFVLACLVFALLLYAMRIPLIGLIASGGGIAILLLVGALFALTAIITASRSSA